jgi:hypothetical protein
MVLHFHAIFSDGISKVSKSYDMELALAVGVMSAKRNMISTNDNKRIVSELRRLLGPDPKTSLRS